MLLLYMLLLLLLLFVISVVLVSNAAVIVIVIITPRRMRSEGYCSCRVCTCVSVCLLFDNSLHEWLFASKTNTHIQRRMEVKKYVGFSLKLLRSRVMA